MRKNEIKAKRLSSAVGTVATRVAAGIGLAVGAGVFQQSAFAANQYYDFSNASGLTAGTATWDAGTTGAWQTSTNPLALAPSVWVAGNDAFFQTGGTNTVTLSGTVLANSITQTTSNTATTIGGGTALQIGAGGITNSGNQALTINSVVNLSASQSWNASTNVITVAGVVGETSAGLSLTKAGGNALTLSATNSYTGATAVSAGTLTVSGAVGSIAASSGVSVAGGGIFNLTYTGATVTNRLNDSGTLTLGSSGGGASAFTLTGNGATSSITEQIGTLSLGAGHSTITLTGAGASQLQTLNATTFSRSGNATALVRGTSLQTAATNATRLTIGGTAGTGLDFVGATTSSVGTVTNGTVKTYRIIPYLIGDTSAANNGNSFLTYDTSTGGLRPLATNEYVTLGASYTTPGTVENARAFNGTISTGGNVTLNSLQFVTNGDTLNGSGGQLIVNSGAVAVTGTTATSVSVGSGFSKVVLGNGTWNEGVLTATSGNTLTFNTPVEVTNNGGITKAGAGTVVLAAANTNTGTYTINQGTLQVSSTGSTHASAAVNATGGGTLLVDAGGAVNGSVTAQISAAQNTYNVVNNGTINALTTIAAATPASANANSNPIVATGHAQLNPGSTTGAITNNGQLTFSGTTAITSIGTISGAGALGGINDANTASKTVTLANNSSFSYYQFKNTTGTALTTLKVAGNGTTSFSSFGYNNIIGGTAAATFDGGTFNLGKIGQNNGGGTTIGTFTLSNGANVNIGTGGYEHGTWNVTNGNMSIAAGGLNEANATSAAASSLGITVNNSGGGSGSLLNVVGNSAIGYTAANSVQTNFVNVGAGGTAAFSANLVVGSSQVATTETNTLTLSSGGKLRVGGALSSNSAGTGQTNAFNWTGGQLSARTITSGAGFNGVGSSLTPTGLTNSAGTLAPGDSGITGLTSITGTYTQNSGGTLSIDLGGPTASTAFQDAANAGKFDTVAVSGNGTVAGDLKVGFVDAFAPTNANSFKILTTVAGGLNGTFATANGVAINGVTRGKTVDGSKTFRVNYNLGDVTLDQFLTPATIGTITGTPASPSIITGGTTTFGVAVQNSAVGGSDSLYFSATAGANTTGSIAGPVTVAAGSTGAQTAGFTFTGTGIGSQTGAFTVSDPNATNSPQAGSVAVTVLAHSNASLRSDVTTTGDNDSLTVDFGTLPQAVGTQNANFYIANLLSGLGVTAGLQLDSFSLTTADSAPLSINLTTFGGTTGNLAASSSNAYLASLDTSTVGTFAETYKLSFSDQNLSGDVAQSDILLTVTGNVVSVPEPVGGAALLLTGLAGFGRRRRRSHIA